MSANILFVEDETDRVRRFVDVLTERGYSVEIAEDAEKAIRLLYTSTFDLVVLDIMMALGEGSNISETVAPKRAGIEVLRKIREGKIRDKEIDANMPVVVLSAVSDRRERQMITEELGVTSYLDKPVALQVFTDTVEDALMERKKEKAESKET